MSALHPTAILAASKEADRLHWQRRFACLIEKGIVSGRPFAPEPLTAEFGRMARPATAPAGQFAARRDYAQCYSLDLARLSVTECQQLCAAVNPAMLAPPLPLPAQSGKAADNPAVRAMYAPASSVFSAALVHAPASSALPAALSLPLLHSACAWILTREQFSTVPLILRLPPGSTTVVRYLDQSAWHELVARSHADPGLLIMPGGDTRLLSDLHSAEARQIVMPDGLFEARADSAWLSFDLNVERLLDCQNLREVLADVLRLADNLVDHLRWPTRSLLHDAHENRRVALQLTGIGDYVDRAGLNPASFATLRRVFRGLALIRRCLLQASAALAATRGPFPALGAERLVHSLVSRFGVNDARLLIRRRSLRQRHLLAISPFALLPTQLLRHDYDDYLHLIPCIRHADIISMRGAELRHQLYIKSYRRLLEGLRAMPGQTAIY